MTTKKIEFRTFGDLLRWHRERAKAAAPKMRKPPHARKSQELAQPTLR